MELDGKLLKRLRAMRIHLTEEEEVREHLLQIMVDNGIIGMETESTVLLIEIAESFVDIDESINVNDEPEEAPSAGGEATEAEIEALADEVEREKAEETERETDILDQLDRSQLKDLIKQAGYDIKVKKSWSDDDIRELIRQRFAEEEAAKKAQEKEERVPGRNGLKLDPRNYEEDRHYFTDVWTKLFPESEFEYSWTGGGGCYIKNRGANGYRAVILVENAYLQKDGSVKCKLYLLLLAKQTELLDEAGISYKRCWSGAPFVKDITMDEAFDIVTQFADIMLANVKRLDRKLGENRKRMESAMNSDTGKKVKVTKSGKKSKATAVAD